MERLINTAARIADTLKARQQTLAVAESSAGGLISAALLAIPGASAYFRGGAVVYTPRARRALLGISGEQLRALGIRSASTAYAELLARTVAERHAADWGLAETGATGPDGNRYGDPAGHACLAIAGPHARSRSLRTGSADRLSNMHAFAEQALLLLIEGLDAATP